LGYLKEITCPGYISFYIVTCQPFVGSRNRALVGSRQLNASQLNTRSAAVGEAVFAPCQAGPHRALLHSRRDDVKYVYVVARRRCRAARVTSSRPVAQEPYYNAVA
jgi:hypothetical protein